MIADQEGNYRPMVHDNFGNAFCDRSCAETYFATLPEGIFCQVTKYADEPPMRR